MRHFSNLDRFSAFYMNYFGSYLMSYSSMKKMPTWQSF